MEVPPEKLNQPTLTDKQIQKLCRTVCLIEEHYGCRQDIEWAFEKDNLYILQARRTKADLGHDNERSEHEIPPITLDRVKGGQRNGELFSHYKRK